LLQQNFWLKQQKKIFVVPNFVAVTKPFFSRARKQRPPHLNLSSLAVFSGVFPDFSTLGVKAGLNQIWPQKLHETVLNRQGRDGVPLDRISLLLVDHNYGPLSGKRLSVKNSY